MTLGDKIKKLREERHLTQEDLAKFIDSTKQTIYKYENNIITNIPSDKIEIIAKVLNTSPTFLMGWDYFDEKYNKNGELANEVRKIEEGLKIPVLGKVAAGIPIEAIEDIEDTEDYEEISKVMASKGEYFALKIHGESMEPKFSEGDIVIVKKQEDIESGEIGVIIVNGSDATVKKVIKQDNGIVLVASNQDIYPPKYYDNKAIIDLPVKILGKVVELRAKF